MPLPPRIENKDVELNILVSFFLSSFLSLMISLCVLNVVIYRSSVNQSSYDPRNGARDRAGRILNYAFPMALEP